MTKEDLKNTKIYLSSVDNRREFQEKVFRLGVKWKAGSRDVKELDKCFFYIDVDLRLSMGSDFDFEVNHFKEHEYEQIFLHDVLSIEEPKEEYKFKPYDRVLVRDHESQQWCPTLYSYYDDSEFALHHVTVADIIYKYCIPYEGNEHLVGTTNSK